MRATRRDRTARALAGVSLGLLLSAAVLPALVPALGPGRDGIAQVCRTGLLIALAPLAAVRAHLALLPVGLAVLGLAFALLDRVSQKRRLRAFLAAHPGRPPAPGDPLYGLARAAGMQRRVRITEASAPAPAFTTGLLLFWLPLGRSLADAAREAIELRADDAAGRFGRLELASAILKAVRLARPGAPAVVPSLDRLSATRRVRRLLGEPLPGPRVPGRRLTATALMLSVVWASALLAGRTQDDAGRAPCNLCVVRQQMAHWLGPSS